jgi:hypothetical protein
MKKIKIYVLAFPFVMVVLLYLCCWHPHREFIHPAISEFFGGLDLDLHSSKIRDIDPGLITDSSSPAYYGHSHNNPKLYIVAYIKYSNPISSLLYAQGDIDGLFAKLDTSYIKCGGEVSINYFHNYFESRLPIKPKHLLDKKDSYELYFWKFDNYIFEITNSSGANINKQLGFKVYKNIQIGYKQLYSDQLFEITPQGDTIEYK